MNFERLKRTTPILIPSLLLIAATSCTKIPENSSVTCGEVVYPISVVDFPKGYEVKTYCPDADNADLTINLDNASTGDTQVAISYIINEDSTITIITDTQQGVKTTLGVINALGTQVTLGSNEVRTFPEVKDADAIVIPTYQ
jgi:hypothetical protein